MTIDEAIRHCREVAEELKGELSEPTFVGNEAKQCEECIEEHLQLAQWLIELKELRTDYTEPVIPEIGAVDDNDNASVECPVCHATQDVSVNSIKQVHCWKCGKLMRWE